MESRSLSPDLRKYLLQVVVRYEWWLRRLIDKKGRRRPIGERAVLRHLFLRPKRSAARSRGVNRPEPLHTCQDAGESREDTSPSAAETAATVSQRRWSG